MECHPRSSGRVEEKLAKTLHAKRAFFVREDRENVFHSSTNPDGMGDEVGDGQFHQWTTGLWHPSDGSINRDRG